LTKVDYAALSGGLDLVSGALNVRPGRMSECLNFEQVFGKQGYKRIDGYERFDGRPEPHKAAYSIQNYKDRVTPITVGQTVTGPSASALVLQVTGGVTGELVLLVTSGAFADNQAIQVSAVTVATADGPTEQGSVAVAGNDALLVLARDARRTVITTVPGSGAVLGVTVYQGDVYAARNSVAGTTATIWRSSAAGWVEVRTGLLPGGKFDFDVANFTGSAKTVSLFGCDGRNRPFRWDGATFTLIDPIFASQSTSVTSQAVTVSSKAFTFAQPARSYAVGQLLTISSRASAANRMSGNVTAFTATTVTVNVTAIVGSGTFTDWDIALTDFSDKPYLATAHKDHLFLAYPQGQLQTSNLGDPLLYTSTAALFGLGDTLTGITSMKGAVLGIFCSNRINILSGTSSLNWQLESYSQSAGARPGTVQESGGNAMFLDDRGLTSLQATQSFGDFEPSIFSRDVKPLLDGLTPLVTASRITRTKFQYRLYAGDTVIAAAILSPEAMIKPSDIAFTRWQYAHRVACVGEGDMTNGQEGLFFGTEDGFVMREDVGPSFDGAVVGSVMRLHFNHLKSPSNKKRFRKLELELDSPGRVTINFRQQFNYSDGAYDASLTQGASSVGAGCQWDASNWDTFFWSLPIVTQAEANIDGVGKNMGLLLLHESATDKPFTLQGLLLQYSIMGLAR
jgi:hypothetical protein